MFLVGVIVLLALYCLWLLKPQPSKLAIPKAVEDHVANVLANVDDGDFTPTELENEGFFTAGMKRGRFQAKLVAIAKAEFGLLPRTQANRLMVRKFLRDHMRERGMRPTHIVQHLDVGVACFFIPSAQDMIAHQLGASREAITREVVINTAWESAYGYIGHMLGFRRE
jgi:hypothetical protein